MGGNLVKNGWKNSCLSLTLSLSLLWILNNHWHLAAGPSNTMSLQPRQKWRCYQKWRCCWIQHAFNLFWLVAHCFSTCSRQTTAAWTHWVAVEVFGTIFHFAQRLKWMHISFQNSVGVCGKAVVPELVLTASSTSRVWTSSPRAGFLGGCLLLVVFIILCWVLHGCCFKNRFFSCLSNPLNRFSFSKDAFFATASPIVSNLNIYLLYTYVVYNLISIFVSFSGGFMSPCMMSRSFSVTHTIISV